MPSLSDTNTGMSPPDDPLDPEFESTPHAVRQDVVLMGPETRTEQALRLKFEDPKTITTICDHVADGGSLVNLCRTWDLPYGKITRWIHADKELNQLYRNAINDRGEWAVDRVLLEVATLSFGNPADIFNEDHSLKPVEEWPDDLKRSVTAIEVQETFDGTGENRTHTGYLKKVKFESKLGGLKLMSQLYKMLSEKAEDGQMKLEDLVTGGKKNE